MSEHVSQPSIAELNDLFRRTTRHIVVTPGIGEYEDLEALVMAVRRYDDFAPGSDPWGEHDFGALDWHDDRVYWKIDYADPDGYWNDPGEPDAGRLLTIMRDFEY